MGVIETIEADAHSMQLKSNRTLFNFLLTFPLSGQFYWRFRSILDFAVFDLDSQESIGVSNENFSY